VLRTFLLTSLDQKSIPQEGGPRPNKEKFWRNMKGGQSRCLKGGGIESRDGIPTRGKGGPGRRRMFARGSGKKKENEVKTSGAVLRKYVDSLDRSEAEKGTWGSCVKRWNRIAKPALGGGGMGPGRAGDSLTTRGGS